MALGAALVLTLAADGSAGRIALSGVFAIQGNALTLRTLVQNATVLLLR